MTVAPTLSAKELQKFIPSANKFLDFVNRSPTAFHATENAKNTLLSEGFTHLSEKDSWDLKPNGKYFYTRNQSTIVAFAVGGKFEPGNGFNLVAAHTDSPHLMVKPRPDHTRSGYIQIEIETYGGGLWSTWFDRDLSLAGRVIVKKGDTYESKLVHIERPLLRIPSIAIHLHRESGSKNEFNNQTQLFPILATTIKAELETKTQEDATKPPQSILYKVIADELKVDASDILELEMSVVDTQKAQLGGLNSEFILSPRLDNLMMSFCSMMGLLDALKSQDYKLSEEKNIIGFALFDNEEVGSESAHGAASPIVNELVRRVTSSEKMVERAIRRSFLVSADMAHGVHPNYSEKHTGSHAPHLNLGTVVKSNVNQRYATNGVTSFLFKEIARKYNIPLQDFVSRNDQPCGTTIGPIISARTGIRTIDIGNAQLSMHSIREQCGIADVTYATDLISRYLQNFTVLDEKLTVD